MTIELIRLLLALGHDPEKVEARIAMGIHRRGLLVSWKDTGQVIRFYTDKQLKRMKRDAGFMSSWEAASP